MHEAERHPDRASKALSGKRLAQALRGATVDRDSPKKKRKRVKTASKEPSEAKFTTQLALRIDFDLLKRLDAHVTRLNVQTPGLVWSRGSAIRVLLIAALEQYERSSAPTTPG
jgi:hypothetical protein